jgi:hypothetical protein
VGLERDSFTIEFQCNCYEEYDGLFTVTVEQGLVTDFRRQDGEPLHGLQTEPPTIDDLFDRAQDALRDDNGDILSLSLDPELGYPVELSIDRRIDLVDDEVSSSVSDVTPLEEAS